MTTDLKGRIQAGFDELETEIQAREAQRGVNAETAATSQAAQKARGIHSGYGRSNNASRPQARNAGARAGTSLSDDALRAMGVELNVKRGMAILSMEGYGKQGQRNMDVLYALAEETQGVEIEGFASIPEQRIHRVKLVDSEAAREFLQKYVKPDGTGLTDEAYKELKRIEVARGGPRRTPFNEAEASRPQARNAGAEASRPSGQNAGAGARAGTSLSDDALRAMGCRVENGTIRVGSNMPSVASVRDVRALHDLAKAAGINSNKVFVTRSNYVLEIPDTPEARALLQKYVKPDGTGLTELAQQELARIRGARSTGGRAGAGATLSDDALKAMGGVDIGAGKIYVGTGAKIGKNSIQAVNALAEIARAEGVNFVTLVDNSDGVLTHNFTIENTEKGREFLRKYMAPDGKGLTDLAQDELARINAGGRSAGQRAGAEAPRPQGRNAGAGARAGTSLSDDAGNGTYRNKPTIDAGRLEQARKYWRRAGLVKKIGTAGAIYALCEFCSDALGAISSGNVVEDGVSVQTPMPEQYRGEVSPADQKYFTKGSPEEAKFRAMLFYAGTQEGGFMGMTQEEWLEYAMRLRQAENGIISPQAELKLRKALVEAYPEYQQAIQEAAKNLSNGEAERQPDATRGIRSGGAEPLDEGQAGPTPSNRGRGNQSSGRTGF